MKTYQETRLEQICDLKGVKDFSQPSENGAVTLIALPDLMGFIKWCTEFSVFKTNPKWSIWYLEVQSRAGVLYPGLWARSRPQWPFLGQIYGASSGCSGAGGNGRGQLIVIAWVWGFLASDDHCSSGTLNSSAGWAPLAPTTHLLLAH